MEQDNMTRFQTLIQTLYLTLLSLHCRSLALTPHLHLLQQQQLHIGPNSAQIRPATEVDLDDIATVVLDAFAPSAVYRYVFPLLDRYKKYHWKCIREALGQEFAGLPVGGFLNVISVPTPHAQREAQGRGVDRVVAVAGWKVIEPEAGASTYGDIWLLGTYHRIAKCSDHLDWNEKRALDFSRQMSSIEQQYVHGYPHRQMYLAILATHPDWDGYGFGATHCHWGMERARNMNIPNTLIATPAGWPLYDSLGFESVVNISIKTIDWPEDFWYEYMRYGH